MNNFIEFFHNDMSFPSIFIKKLNGIISYVDELFQNAVYSDTVTEIWSGTQAEYDALTTKSDNILYIIK